MKQRCKYCRRKISVSGMPAHVSAKHRGLVLAEFRMNPLIQAAGLINTGVLIGFGDQKQLPAPNPLTVYSWRPLGVMAAPIPEHRVPKGYTLPYGYARPFERVRLPLIVWSNRYGRRASEI